MPSQSSSFEEQVGSIYVSSQGQNPCELDHEYHYLCTYWNSCLQVQTATQSGLLPSCLHCGSLFVQTLNITTGLLFWFVLWMSHLCTYVASVWEGSVTASALLLLGLQQDTVVPFLCPLLIVLRDCFRVIYCTIHFGIVVESRKIDLCTAPTG